MKLERQHFDSSAEALIRTLDTEHGVAYATRLVQQLLQDALLRARPKADVLAEERRVAEQMVAIQRRGRLWVVKLGSRAALVPSSLGMTYMATLLANPGYEIAAIELVARRGLPSALPAEGPASSGQPVLDAQAKHAYRERLAALEVELDEHEANNDLAWAERARAERDWLITELAAAAGLTGRVRTFSGNQERARVSVGKAIRRAIDRIATTEPVIADTLRTTIRTGLRCCYQPY